MKRFYFPLVYMFSTRYKTKLDKVSWLLQRMIPVFIIIFFQLSLQSSDLLIYLFLYIISEMVFISLYEIGYIYNDAITIRNEESPTLRLNDIQVSFFQKNFYKTASIKLSISLLGTLIIIFIANQMEIQLYISLFISTMVTMVIAFTLHNNIRNRFNIITFIFLVCSKFSYTIVLFIPVSQLIYPLLIITLMFPLPRILEHMSKPKYKLIQLSKVIGNHDLFRVKYFILLLTLVVIFKDLKDIDVNLMLVMFLYFFLYRLVSLLLVKLKIHQRQ